MRMWNCAVGVMCILAVSTNAYSQSDPCDEGYVPRDFIVGFVPSVTAAAGFVLVKDAAAAINVNAELMTELSFINAAHVSFSNADTSQTAFLIALLQLLPEIEYVEPNVTYRATTNYPTPQTDRMLDQLWHLETTAIDEAWMVQVPDAQIVVAIVDGGVELDHEDLADNLWRNPDEIPNNDIDDNADGYVDDVHGYDFRNNDGSPTPELKPDGSYEIHGTHVAGTIGAVGLNDCGMAGAAWRVRLMPLKFLNSAECGTAADAVRAIHYATLKGARIINMSFGSSQYCQALYNALQQAAASDILLVSSAGNGQCDTDKPGKEHYPSNYDIPGLLSVTATVKVGDELWFDSNWGLRTVDLGAPGYYIVSTAPVSKSGSNIGEAGYYRTSGTSMAAAVVSGVAALVQARHPYLCADEIKQLLIKSTDCASALNGRVVSGGRINALSAIDRGFLSSWFDDYISQLPIEFQTLLRDYFNSLSEAQQMRLYLAH